MTFRVETRNGRHYEKTTTCWPSKYAYACAPNPALDEEQGFYLTRAGEQHIMLRDRKGQLAKLFGTVLNSDDRPFKLNALPAADCRF